MVSEKQLLCELQTFIQTNIDAYMNLHQTAEQASSIAVRVVLEKAARKRALLVKELSNVYHNFTTDNELAKTRMLLPQPLQEEIEMVPHKEINTYPSIAI